MKKEQSAKLAMGHAVSNVLETFTATGVPVVLATKHAALKTSMNAITAAAAAQGEPTVGKTEDRVSVFDDMTTATRSVGSAVGSYAGSHKLGDLLAKVRIAPSALRRLRATEKIRFAQQVHDAAEGVLMALADYGMTAAVLADLQTKIDAANANLSASRDAIVTRKVATAGLKGAIGEFDALLRHELDPLVESLRDSHPTEHAAYRAARITINPTRSAEQSSTSAAELAPVIPHATTAAIAPKEVAA